MLTENNGLSSILESLEVKHEKDGMEFALLTKDSEMNANYKVYFSPGFSKSKQAKLLNIVDSLDQEDINNIWEIKPALKECYSLEISKQSTLQLLDQYYDLMSCLSQAVCKTIAKEWIKVAEPKKQALYPYKFYNSSKPPWWPAKVNHIEPDHLDKDSRINVLINILRNPSFDLHALKLRTSILGFKYPVTLSLLNEVYYLALYDRLLFGQGRDDPALAKVMSGLKGHERAKILSGKIGIMVSDIKKISSKIRHRGLIMVRQIKETWLNENVYSINLAIPHGANHFEDTPHRSIVRNSPRGFEKSCREVSHDDENKENIPLNASARSVLWESPMSKKRKLARHRSGTNNENLVHNNNTTLHDIKKKNCNSLGITDPPIKLKQDLDFLNMYPDVDYSVVSQDIIEHIDTSLDRYSGSASSDDYYLVSSTFER